MSALNTSSTHSSDLDMPPTALTPSDAQVMLPASTPRESAPDQCPSGNSLSPSVALAPISPVTPPTAAAATPHPSTPDAPVKPSQDAIPPSHAPVNLESMPVTATVTKIFTPSAILQLPKEIRTRIYRYALFPKGTVCAPKPHFSPTSCWRIKPPALIRTCFEMRQDVIKIYYGHFHITARSARDLIPFLRSLDPEARAALGKVSLKYDWYDKKHLTIDRQVNKTLATYKVAGVELKRAAIAITGVVVTE